MKFIGYQLTSEDDKHWNFRLISDLETGSLVLSKDGQSAKINGMTRTLRFVLSADFIKQFALKVLKSTPDRNEFAYSRVINN